MQKNFSATWNLQEALDMKEVNVFLITIFAVLTSGCGGGSPWTPDAGMSSALSAETKGAPSWPDGDAVKGINSNTNPSDLQEPAPEIVQDIGKNRPLRIDYPKNEAAETYGMPRIIPDSNSVQSE